MPNETALPTSATLFPDSKEDCDGRYFKVGDWVTWRSGRSGSEMETSHGVGPFKVLAIFRGTCAGGVCVVIGKLVDSFWMIYNGRRGKWEIPSPLTGEWHFWKDGPSLFDEAHFSLVRPNTTE